MMLLFCSQFPKHFPKKIPKKCVQLIYVFDTPNNPT